MTTTFTTRELGDLAIAWIALGIAFTLFLNREFTTRLLADPGRISIAAVLGTFFVSLLTVGIGFLLHELAHKVVAIRFGQDAHFRADYGMLALAIASGLAGFIFAAPGAVHHVGRITPRENGLIALAGPVTNLVLAAVFFPFTGASGFLGTIGGFGVLINLILATFNLLPFGPLDGRKVLAWNRIVFVLVFLGSLGLTVGWVFG